MDDKGGDTREKKEKAEASQPEGEERAFWRACSDEWELSQMV